MKQRILILTASVGSGHVKAAEALSAELRHRLPEAEISTVDFMSGSISMLNAFMKRIYLSMLAIVPNLYDIFYRFAGSDVSGGGIRSVLSCLMLPAMKSILNRYRPDIVICTHPFPEGAASHFRTERNFFLATVMTDYSLHQIWLSKNIDCYFMATQTMKDEMVGMGFPSERLFADGIPILGSFDELPKREEIRRDYAITEDAKTILVMGGGLGLGGIGDSLQALDSIPEQLALIVISGHNRRLHEHVLKFAARSHHHVLAFEYTDQVHALMKASDLLITKPGALTISEAFAVGLPMLLHDPIPGPETSNAVYAYRHGAAVWLHPGESLVEAVTHLFSNNRLHEMREAALKVARSEAAERISRHLLSLYRGKSPTI